MAPVMVARGPHKRSRWQSKLAVATATAIPAATSMITAEGSLLRARVGTLQEVSARNLSRWMRPVGVRRLVGPGLVRARFWRLVG